MEVKTKQKWNFGEERVSDVELLFLGEIMAIGDEFKDYAPVRPALLRFGGVSFFGEELRATLLDVYILSYRKRFICIYFALSNRMEELLTFYHALPQFTIM
jgi:hypothetical protein